MKAADVLEALYRRKAWADDSAVIKIQEAPDSADRMGRKIDLLVLHCWRSKGFQVEAVEVKVSTSDLRAEIANPAKSAFWFGHSHRFWLATTPKVYEACRHEIPETWGVIVVGDTGRTRAVKQAPKRAAKPLSHGVWIGILRAANSSESRRAEYRRGHQDGLTQARRSAEQEANLRHREHDKLLERVEAFEVASGLKIRHGWNNDQIGHVVRQVVAGRQILKETRAELERSRDAAIAALETLDTKP